MKNPEKSVEEIVEEFIKNNGIVLLKEFTKGDVIGLQSIRPQLENLLQAERQKRDEMLEVIKNIPCVNPDYTNAGYTTGQQMEIRAYNQAIEDVIQALTQTNNPK